MYTDNFKVNSSLYRQETYPEKEAEKVQLAFRDVYTMAAHFMPPNSFEQMEVKLRPVFDAIIKTNQHLMLTEEKYVRQKLTTAVLLKANDHLRTKASVIASKFMTNMN